MLRISHREAVESKNLLWNNIYTHIHLDCDTHEVTLRNRHDTHDHLTHRVISIWRVKHWGQVIHVIIVCTLFASFTNNESPNSIFYMWLSRSQRERKISHFNDVQCVRPLLFENVFQVTSPHPFFSAASKAYYVLLLFTRLTSLLIEHKLAM